VQKVSGEFGMFFTIKIKIQRLNRYIHPAEHISALPKIIIMVDLYLREPSLNLLPQFQGTMLPSLSFSINTTGFNIPGTAAEASRAVQITVSGAVI
jgi:hypothetical protein